MQIIVATGELVKPQNLYILAKGFSGEILLFKDMKSLSPPEIEWFKVSSYIIKSALDREQAILGINNIDYKLLRKSCLNKEEWVNSGITNPQFEMLVSSVWPL